MNKRGASGVSAEVRVKAMCTRMRISGHASLAAICLSAVALACSSTASPNMKNQIITGDLIQKPSQAPQAANEVSNSEQPSLRLSVEDEVWDDESQARVRVQVVNTSEQSQDVAGLASFHLFKEGAGSKEEETRETYYALANLQEPNLPAKRPALSTLNLAKGQSVEQSFDLKNLLWGRSIYSSLPTKALLEAVPKGEFRLRFDLRVYRTGEKNAAPVKRTTQPVRLVSNEVVISIR